MQLCSVCIRIMILKHHVSGIHSHSQEGGFMIIRLSVCFVTMQHHSVSEFWACICHVANVSNGSGLPTRRPDLECKHCSVWVPNRPTTRPTASWRETAWSVPVNPWVSPGLARPVGSNLQFWNSGLFDLWSHSDILLLINNYWLWYIIVLFRWIGHLFSQKQERPGPCPILKRRVNAASMIFCRVCQVTDQSHSYFKAYWRYWPP